MSGSSNSSNVAVFFTHSHCDWRPMWREALYQMFYIIILFIPSKQHWGRQDCPPFVNEDSELHRLNLLSEVTQLVSGRAGIWTWFYPKPIFIMLFHFSSVQSLSRVRLFATPWITAQIWPAQSRRGHIGKTNKQVRYPWKLPSFVKFPFIHWDVSCGVCMWHVTSQAICGSQC